MTIEAVRTGHVGLNVTDLERSLAFYRRVFGFEVLESADGHAFLGRDGRLLVTLWKQGEGEFPTARPGLHHLSFEVDTVEEVRAAEGVLRGLDVRFAHDGVVPHGEGATSGGIFFTDPDGIRLEIFTASGVSGDAPTPGAPTCGFF
ncbi:VOC family protein [Actinosynnema sp. NPDC020468]|uniref:VOC family protein n=1 Tax=Actinosynnema sp. NPDC020468 TaxID=3154488 RepID=UPI0033D4E935